MPLYTFYPCHPDGTSETFVTFELVDDEEASLRAVHVLDQHASASHVVVWCGARKVRARQRALPDVATAPSQRRVA